MLQVSGPVRQWERPDSRLEISMAGLEGVRDAVGCFAKLLNKRLKNYFTVL
jgi:hypothetical protein